MKVMYSCVIDEQPKFAHQAFAWVASLLANTNQKADLLLVHFVNDCHPSYKRLFNSWGVQTRSVKPFDSRHPHSNKLTQLESEPLQAADYLVLCDCDLAFCEDISPAITGDAVRAKVVDLANLSLNHWQQIFSAAHVPFPTEKTKATFDHQATLSLYCNGGLLILPQAIYQSLRQVWPKWNRWLLERPKLLKPFAFFTDQISFALSLAELGLTINHLEAEYNFPTHLPYASPNELNIFPKVLHYHDHVDRNGFLLHTQIPSVDQQIKKINLLIESQRQQYLMAAPDGAQRRMSILSWSGAKFAQRAK